MRGKPRSIHEKGTAVGIALMTSAEEASRQTGIPGRTIREWLESAEFAELRQTPREAVGEAMWVAIQEAAHELREGVKNPKAYLRDKVAAFEALVEKRALIMGDATARMETKDISELDSITRRRLRERFANLGTVPQGDSGDGVAAASAQGSDASAG